MPLWLTIAEGPPFAKAQGIALGITISLAAIVSSILYLAADHPPTLDGKSLALEFELKSANAEDVNSGKYAKFARESLR